ncbi:MAG: hypothetical protein GY832_18860 [Chloroflexi bacterium]|nr:hypothetical protein [Chloroflexota bacterium]
MQNTYAPTSGAALTTVEKMARITQALADLDRQLDTLRAQVAALDDAGVCTGTAWWRRDNGAAPKMYANHGVNQACPIHGTPEQEKRLRVYIGLDPDKQAQAQAAFERCEEKAALKQQIDRIEIKIGRIERAITNAYYAASNQQRWEW